MRIAVKMLSKNFRRGLSSLLVLTVTFQNLAFAADGTHTAPSVSVAPRMRTKSVSLESQVAREELRKFKSGDDWAFNQTVFAELRNLIEAEFKADQGIEYHDFLTRDSKSTWDTYIHMFFMLSYAKSGYMGLAYLHRDSAAAAMVQLFRATESIPENIREPYRAALMHGIYQWAFATTGPVTLPEKKRVDFILSDFHRLIFDPARINTIYKTYINRSDVDKEIGSKFVSVIAYVDIPIAALFVLSLFLGPQEFIHNHSGTIFLATIANMFAIPGITYLYNTRIDSKAKISILTRSRIEETMKSYLKFDFNLNLAGKITHLPTTPSLGGRVKTEIPDEKLSELNVESLKDYLHDPVNSNEDILTLFSSVIENPKVSASVDQAIQSDQDLKDLADKGKIFKAGYNEKLDHDFGRQRDYVVDPELQILKELIAQQKIEIDNQNVQITLKQAEDRAWEETKNYFGVPYGMEVSDLETKKYESDQYLTIYNYFKKRFYTLQQVENPRNLPNEVEISRFKLSVQKETQNLRILNFKKTLEQFHAMYPDRKTVKVRTTQGTITVSLTTLANSTVSFEDTQTYQRPFGLNDKRINDTLFEKRTNFANKDQAKDHVDANDFYRVQPITPLIMHNQIHLKSNGTEILLTEASFSRLMYELGPRHYTYHDNNLLPERYLVEGVRRDALLADALAFVDEVQDVSAKDLSERLQKKIQDRTDVGTDTKTLTEELRDNTYVLDDVGSLNDIRWYGYSLNADYWRARALDAFAYKRDLKDVKPTEHLKPEDEKEVEKENQELITNVIDEREKIVEQRTQSYRKRFEKSTAAAVIGGALTSILLAIGGGSAIWLINHGFTDGLSQAMKNAVDSVKSHLPDGPKLPSGGTGQPGALNFGDTAPTNNGAKDTEDAEDGPPFFEFHNGGKADVPEYLNFPRISNLPSDAEDLEAEALKGFAGEIEYDKTIIAHKKKDKTPVTGFDILTNIPVAAKGTFLPVPSPSRFRVNNIEIFIRGSAVPRWGYKTFFDNRTGLSYIRLDEVLSDRQFTLAISYKPIEKFHKYNPAEWTTSHTEITKLNGSLYGIDATVLAKNLEGVEAKDAQVDIETLDTVFGASGVYTYDKENTPSFFDRFSSNPFQDFKKFVRGDTFYYQCSASNTLFVNYLSEYYKTHKTDIDVQTLVGFRMDPSKEQPISNVGHMHGIATHKLTPYLYTELDATPSTMDPKYANKKSGAGRDIAKKQKEWEFQQQTEEQKEKEKRKTGEDEKDMPWILPAELKPVRTRDGKTTDESFKVKTAPKPKPVEEPKVEKTAETVRRMPTLEEFNALVSKIHAELETHHKTGPKDLAAFQSLTLVPQMREYLINGKTDDLIRQLLRVEYDFSGSRINKSSERFVETKVQELRNANGNSDVKVLAGLMEGVKSKFQYHVDEEQSRTLSVKSHLILHNSSFLNLMSEYFSMMALSATYAKPSAARLISNQCSALFARRI